MATTPTAGGTRPQLFSTFVGVSQRPEGWAWPVTMLLHGLVAAAVLLVPLLGDPPLPAENDGLVKAFFVSPALAPPPPPPPARSAKTAPLAPRNASGALTAPVEVPETIATESSLDTGFEGGVPGGVEGGVPGGVVGGIVAGIEAAPPPPPPLVRVGGAISEPRKLKDVAPLYPSIARAARIQGRVILECTISPQGRVEGVQVLKGVPPLDEAAVAAVKQWLYRPTLLAGEPVAVVMTVTVNFVLRDGGSF